MKINYPIYKEYNLMETFMLQQHFSKSNSLNSKCQIPKHLLSIIYPKKNQLSVIKFAIIFMGHVNDFLF